MSATHNHHDHTEHHRMMIRDFRKRFYVSVVLTVPILALSPLIRMNTRRTADGGRRTVERSSLFTAEESPHPIQEPRVQ